MIGQVKNISRFGVFITILSSDICEDDLLRLGHFHMEIPAVLTGLLRFSEIPSGEKFYRHETLYNLKIKTIRADNKIELSLVPEIFLEKYEKKVAETLAILKDLQAKNQEVRNL